jgi:hypothetical protein
MNQLGLPQVPDAKARLPPGKACAGPSALAGAAFRRFSKAAKADSVTVSPFCPLGSNLLACCFLWRFVSAWP